MRTPIAALMLAAAVVANAQDAAAPALRKVTDVGPALEEPITDLYVAPTRATRPFVATARDVRFLTADGAGWQTVYSAPPAAQPIVAVRGYDKSSKVLYVVHQGSVACTRTGEAPWTESVASGFTAASFVDLVVHPEDRKVAFLVSETAAWKTIDAGTTWGTWEMPGAAEKATGIGITTVSGKPLLVYATDKSVYLSDEKFRTWTTLSREPQGPRLLAVGSGFATTQLETGILRGYDLSRPGYRTESPAAPLGQRLASDTTGYGAFYIMDGKTILASTFSSKNPPEVVHTAETTPTSLVAHPRMANAVYWVEGGQVRLMEGTATGFPSAAIPADAFARGTDVPSTEVPAVAASTSTNDEAARILNEVMSRQVPLEEVVAAALKYSAYSTREAEAWKSNVRRKNLVPQLVVAGGATERGIDQHGTVTNVDRFGVPSVNDIEKDDRTSYMGTYGVELRWSLSGLVFDKEQLMVSEETRKRNESRNTLVAQVTEVYYRRLELLVRIKMNQGTETVPDALQSQLRLRQLTDTLNGLTGYEIAKDE